MNTKKLAPDRGTKLRKNGSEVLKISVNFETLGNIFIINESEFLTDKISAEDLIISPHSHYMLINKANYVITVKYDKDISSHQVIYDPYKYENEEKRQIDPHQFKSSHEVPDGYIDILPKWYSIKFTYPDYNIIYIKPEMGISFQIHKERTEYWEIIGGNPIILNDHTLHYFVRSGTKFKNHIGTYHSIINPNQKDGEYVILKERWSGNFDEQDIKRVFNPNHYEDDSN
ncbi:MAG: hypothetical protein EU541_03925 [Promethearchaeota archaeon]|nr:MAG: hypothetical protein EU541_03925 [Candidatus Lokiarchaeota archaeon]